jgi:regulator of replication initiation timing
MARERQCWHERIAEALQRVRQLDADLTAARDDNKRLVAELRELRERLSR